MRAEHWRSRSLWLHCLEHAVLFVCLGSIWALLSCACQSPGIAQMLPPDLTAAAGDTARAILLVLAGLGLKAALGAWAAQRASKAAARAAWPMLCSELQS